MGSHNRLYYLLDIADIWIIIASIPIMACNTHWNLNQNAVISTPWSILSGHFCFNYTPYHYGYFYVGSYYLLLLGSSCLKTPPHRHIR